jgi:hypothetical protein
MPFAIVDLISGSPNYGDQAAHQEAKRKKLIAQGTTAIDNAFAGFNPAFFQKRAQDYIDYATPQVGKQYRNARNDISFGLANRGLLGSGAAQKQWGDLSTTYNQALQNVRDTATGQSQQLQQAVEGAKDTQLSFLYQSADPAQAAAGATAAAAGVATPATFPQVADQFNNLLNTYYYSQLVNAYRPSSFVSLPPNYSGGAPLGQSSQSIGGG